MPGWPIGFGDDAKARELLQKALAINPDGIDSNYFYGEFLYRKGETTGAPGARARSRRRRVRAPLADEGRRKEIESLLAALR